MKKMIVLLCGWSGCGKSSVADNIGKTFNLKVVHSSGIYLQLIKEKKIDETKAKKNQGFWESKEGEKLFQKRIETAHSEESLDKILDKKLLEVIEKGNVVMDSWTMPWLSKKGIKIWLEVSDKERARRIAERDKISEKEALKKVKEKERKTIELYKNLYGFDFGKDEKVFGLILNTNDLSLEEVTGKVEEFLRKLI